MKDKRSFDRYDHSVDIELLFNGKTYRLTTLDYSLDGLRAESREPFGFKKGDVVKIGFPDSSNHGSGQVAWTSSRGGRYRAGIRKFGTLQGALRDFAASDILLGLHRETKTGMLYLIEGTTTRVIHYRAGDISYATSNHPSERFAERLVTKGVITTGQYKQALDAASKTEKRFGTLLVEFGFLEDWWLTEEVSEHVTRIVTSIFRLKDTDFYFKDLPVPTDDLVSLHLSPADMIYKGFKALADIEHLMRHTPSMDSKLAFSRDPLDLYQEIMVEDSDRKILSAIDGKRSINDLLVMFHKDRGSTLNTIMAFLSTKTIEARETTSRSSYNVTAADVFPSSKIDASFDFAEDIDFMFEHHEDIGYYGVLGLKRETATAQDIERAYYAKSRVFHPDRHYGLSKDAQEKLKTLFDYIKTAYTVLIDDDSRSKYDLKPFVIPADKNKLFEANKRYNAGKAEMSSGRFKSAARLFDAAANLDSTASEYSFHASMAHLRSENLREAEKAIQQALKLAPQNPHYLSEAGHIYLALKLSLRARSHFEKALSEQPGNKRAHEGMALLPKK